MTNTTTAADTREASASRDIRTNRAVRTSAAGHSRPQPKSFTVILRSNADSTFNADLDLGPNVTPATLVSQSLNPIASAARALLDTGAADRYDRLYIRFDRSPISITGKAGALASLGDRELPEYLAVFTPPKDRTTGAEREAAKAAAAQDRQKAYMLRQAKKLEAQFHYSPFDVLKSLRIGNSDGKADTSTDTTVDATLSLVPSVYGSIKAYTDMLTSVGYSAEEVEALRDEAVKANSIKASGGGSVINSSVEVASAVETPNV